MIIAREVAAAVDAPLERILSDAVVNAESDLEGAEEARNDMVAKLDRMRRQRQVPQEAHLHAIARHEANLDRAFHRAMTQLEAMRAAREGRPRPLARLQVHA